MTYSMTRAAIAGVLALGLAGVAQAQQQIPTPANPTPRFPIATDGTPLPPYNNAYNGGVLTGRSGFAPLDGFVGLADTAAGAGLGAAGDVVGGTVGAVGRR